MLGPFATASRFTSIHQVSLAVLSRAACASMSTTTTTTTTRDRGDRYGPMEWAQWCRIGYLHVLSYTVIVLYCSATSLDAKPWLLLSSVQYDGGHRWTTSACTLSTADCNLTTVLSVITAVATYHLPGLAALIEVALNQNCYLIENI